MKIGVISDTHDNVIMIQKAVTLFNDESVDLVLHAGDYVSPFSLKPFLGLECDMLGVWGNNDGDKIALDRAAQGRIMTSPYVVTYFGKKILLAHYLVTLEALISSQAYHIIIYGHTHKPDLRKRGQTLIINPGECGGWLSGKSTIAIVELDTQTAKILELYSRME